MPLMMVWPVSSSVCARKEGSSFWSFARASPSFFESAWVRGSMATEMTGSGNSIRSRRIGCFGSQRVSPVVTLLSPTAAMI